MGNLCSRSDKHYIAKYSPQLYSKFQYDQKGNIVNSSQNSFGVDERVPLGHLLARLQGKRKARRNLSRLENFVANNVSGAHHLNSSEQNERYPGKRVPIDWKAHTN